MYLTSYSSKYFMESVFEYHKKCFINKRNIIIKSECKLESHFSDSKWFPDQGLGFGVMILGFIYFLFLLPFPCCHSPFCSSVPPLSPHISPWYVSGFSYSSLICTLSLFALCLAFATLVFVFLTCFCFFWFPWSFGFVFT